MECNGQPIYKKRGWDVLNNEQGMLFIYHYVECLQCNISAFNAFSIITGFNIVNIYLYKYI